MGGRAGQTRGRLEDCRGPVLRGVGIRKQSVVEEAWLALFVTNNHNIQITGRIANEAFLPSKKNLMANISTWDAVPAVAAPVVAEDDDEPVGRTSSRAIYF